MTSDDVVGLSIRLHALYGEKCPKLGKEMLRLWHEELRAQDVETVHAAVKRWARQHRPDYPPMLQGLLDTVELLLEEREDAEEQRRRLAARETSGLDTYVDQLHAAAAQASPLTQSWGAAHVEMIRLGLGRPGTYEATAAQCERYAAQYPDDAPYWQQEAAWWQAGAPGRLYFTSYRAPVAAGYDRDPGEEG